MRRFFLILFTAGISLGAGVLAWQMMQKAAQPQKLQQYPAPKPIANMQLVDETGTRFMFEQFAGRWHLLFFGFTHCPDICPATLAQLAATGRLLSERLSPDQLPQVALISVDPERDTPARLKAYVQHFNPAFKGLTGEHAQLKALALQLGAIYHIEEHSPGAQLYNVDHSAGIFVLNPQAQLTGVFPAPHDPATLAEDLLLLLGRQ